MNWLLAAGSLAAVLALAGIAWGLKLGGEGRIDDEAHAMSLAEDALAGFEARDAVVCGKGGGAIVIGADGTVALIRPSGARFIIRQTRRPQWHADAEGLTVQAGDLIPVRLTVKPAEAERVGRCLDAAADNDVSMARA